MRYFRATGSCWAISDPAANVLTRTLPPDFPDLVIVAGHIGYPWTAEMIARATKYENVYINTSASTVRRYPPELGQYMRGHGRHKVMFGTNYPMIAAAKAPEGLDDLGLDADAKASFLGGNAARVFRINQ